MLAVDHMLRRQWIVRAGHQAVRGLRKIRRVCPWLAFPMLLGVIVASITGCAVGPNFNPAAVPDVDGYVPGRLSSPNPGPGGPRVAGQHFVTGAEVSARWWSAFKSPPLHELIKQSVDHNTNLQAAEAAIKIAQYNVLSQRALFFPQLPVHSTSSDILVAN